MIMMQRHEELVAIDSFLVLGRNPHLSSRKLVSTRHFHQTGIEFSRDGINARMLCSSSDYR